MAGEDGYEDEKLKAFALVFERLRGAVADTPIHELLLSLIHILCTPGKLLKARDTALHVSAVYASCHISADRIL